MEEGENSRKNKDFLERRKKKQGNPEKQEDQGTKVSQKRPCRTSFQLCTVYTVSRVALHCATKPRSSNGILKGLLSGLLIK